MPILKLAVTLVTPLEVKTAQADVPPEMKVPDVPPPTPMVHEVSVVR